MNRRRFLQYTIALAVSAPLAKLGVVPTGAQVPTVDLHDPRLWIPTQAQVDEWLTYYKAAVGQGVRRFADIFLGLPEVLDAEDGPIVVHVPDHSLYDQAERAFGLLQGDRFAVGGSQSHGYNAGREGQPRFNPLYTAPSNESFGWYNGWATGNFDYLWRRGEVTLPRSPGVTRPHAKSSLARYS